MKTLLAVACLMLLSGCWCSAPTKPTEIVREAPAACLTECQPAPIPSDPTLEGVSRSLDDWQTAYEACRLKHRECSAWVRRAVEK